MPESERGQIPHAPIAGRQLVCPVVRAARFALAHVPDLVPSGSKPRRELAARPEIREKLRASRRSFAAAVAYPPHQAMLGNLQLEALREIPRPWHLHLVPDAQAEGPGGILLNEEEFCAWLTRSDGAHLLRWRKEYAPQVEELWRTTLLAEHAALERAVREGAEPLWAPDGELAGVVLPAHEQDEALSAPVMLENLAAKVTGALALRQLLEETPADLPVEFLLGCGEEAVGDRYQRGGGNLAKAMGELAEVRTAGAADVKAFCAGPLHAMILAGALVASGVYRRVVVVGGGSLAKLGMKFQGHLKAGYPILEDVLVGVAIDLVPDDGRSPLLRLDASAVHRVGDGAAPHQVAAALTQAPLAARGLRLRDVDRFAVELHNPDITEPAGSGDVPAASYRMLAALAAQAGEISREEMPAFEKARGLPGFSPTQGHIASAIPYLPHAIAGLVRGTLSRVQLVAKGSLFLGRMTAQGDGASILLERNAQ